MNRCYRRAAAMAAMACATLPALTARAQAVPGVGAGGQPQTPTAMTVPPQPGSTYAPLPAQSAAGASAASSNGTIGGGNATESSAHPVTGDEEDSFDLGSRGKGGAIAHGSEAGPIFVGGRSFGGETPASHTVRRGETLWGMCDFYFRNPYEWPKLWSYNPQIKNPNWIYPGDEIRLKPADENGKNEAGVAAPSPRDPAKMTLVDRRRRVPNDTVFLRDQGWVRDESDDVWGEVTGAAQETMFLSDLNQVYLTIRGGHNVQIGQELTLFRTRTSAAAGAIVQILGTVRVNAWNPDSHIARAQIVETLDVIERGAKVGALARSFAVVPPRRNDADVEAHVLASVHPNEFFGQNQVVFIDRGEGAGLKPGNRLFIVRRGDAWRQTLVAAEASLRISADDERPMPPMEKTPGSRRDDQRYPDEVVAELRVLATKKDTAVCLVTQARSEIELRDLVVARKGY